MDDAVEDKPGGQKERLGMVVIRGNAVVMLEVRILQDLCGTKANNDLQALDRIHTDDHNKGGR